MIRAALLALGVGAPTSFAAWVFSAADGSAQAFIYGIPVAAVVGFLSMVYKLLWNAVDDERRGRDTDRTAHSAELAEMNRASIERAERVATLLGEVNRLLPTLLERVAEVNKLATALSKTRAPARKAAQR